MSDPLPAIPSWLALITIHGATPMRVEIFHSIRAATARRKQLERLRQLNHLTLSVRTGNPGTHYLMAGLTPVDTL